MKGRAVPDPDDVRQAGRVLRPGGLHRLIERVPQEILPGLGLDGNEPICVLGFQHGLQLIGVDALARSMTDLVSSDTTSALPSLRKNYLAFYPQSAPATAGQLGRGTCRYCFPKTASK